MQKTDSAFIRQILRVGNKEDANYLNDIWNYKHTLRNDTKTYFISK